MKQVKSQLNNAQLFLAFMLIALVMGIIDATGILRKKVVALADVPAEITTATTTPKITPNIVVKEVKLLTNKPDVELQIRAIADELNFKWPDYLVKLANCESKMNPLAVNSYGNVPNHSRDRGLFQYNSYWQVKVSDECAFSVDCATRKTIEMINAGQQNLWTCNGIVLAKK